jgi:hypothetical protein
MKKLYKIWQEKNNYWDTYDSAVVCANNPIEARHIHPNGHEIKNWWKDDNEYESDWAHPDDVQVEFIGTAWATLDIGVVLASFKGG